MQSGVRSRTQVDFQRQFIKLDNVKRCESFLNRARGRYEKILRERTLRQDASWRFPTMCWILLWHATISTNLTSLECQFEFVHMNHSEIKEIKCNPQCSESYHYHAAILIKRRDIFIIKNLKSRMVIKLRTERKANEMSGLGRT